MAQSCEAFAKLQDSTISNPTKQYQGQDSIEPVVPESRVTDTDWGLVGKKGIQSLYDTAYHSLSPY